MTRKYSIHMRCVMILIRYVALNRKLDMGLSDTKVPEWLSLRSQGASHSDSVCARCHQHGTRKYREKTRTSSMSAARSKTCHTEIAGETRSYLVARTWVQCWWTMTYSAVVPCQRLPATRSCSPKNCSREP